MNEAKRKKVMYGVLIIAVIWGAWNFTHPRQKKTYQSTQDDQAMAVAESVAAAQQPVVIDLAAKQSEPWGRDPFRSSSGYSAKSGTAKPTGVAQTGIVGTWSLTGILDNGATPFAFINGQMVKEGDEINHAKVIKIEKTKVTLSRNGNQFLLQVNKG